MVDDATLPLVAGAARGEGSSPDTVRRAAWEAAQQVLAQELESLGGNLEERLCEDTRLCARFLAVRERAAAELQAAGNFDAYEFNNVYARFYIAARNELSAPVAAGGNVASTADKRLLPSFSKMQKELEEKRMRSLSWKLESESDLAGVAEQSGNSVSSTVDPNDLLKASEGQAGESIFSWRGDGKAPQLVLRVPAAVRGKLLQLARDFVARHCAASAATAESQVALATRILHVTVLNYLVASSSLYWGFGPEVYLNASKLGAVLECYASPFNHSLPLFCSPCGPLDLVFGSLGSFHHERVDKLVKLLPDGALLVANPPYIESELSACTTRLQALLDGRALSAVSIFPGWTGADGLERYRQWAADSKGVVEELPRGQHAYHDYQDSRDITAKFASIGFAVGPLAEEAASLLRLLRREGASSGASGAGAARSRADARRAAKRARTSATS